MTQRELERSPFIQAKDHVNGAFLGNKIQQNKEAEVFFLKRQSLIFIKARLYGLNTFSKVNKSDCIHVCKDKPWW